MSDGKGVVAAGHDLTIRAAGEILKSGGNAFDAVVAGHLAACVTEPVLSSAGGGGFLLTQTSGGSQMLYDFFTQTPLRHRNPEEIEFYPISADFGETMQEFHIGMGAFATPGTVKGLFAVHRDLCSMPMKRLAEPAIEMARKGVVMNHFQSYIIDIVSPVFRASEEALRVYGKPGENREKGSNGKPGIGSETHEAVGLKDKGASENKAKLVEEGDVLFQPELADFLEELAAEGDDFFYCGEVAQSIARLSRDLGGQVTAEDLENYEVFRRRPLEVAYRNSRLAINPAPSSGGTLIAFALKLMEEVDMAGMPYGSPGHLLHLARVQQLTDMARLDRLADRNLPDAGFLDPDYLRRFQDQIRNYARKYGGTTHISIMDSDGNTAALTTSNGEGCGRILPGSGVMLNNMLGEEDLHPDGFHKWPENTRITSMMAPAILNRPDGSVIALGSGGSNRIRTAILQVLLNIIDHGMSVEDAVTRPRIHCEKDFLSVEYGFDRDVLARVVKEWPDHKLWSGSNLFFGGTHSVMYGPSGFHGAGDPRRGGSARLF
ncbi:gamma-glutamyltransferase family protein [Natronogracilivirga saccharolytica]|uniref:Gamma-glutamyltransferase n=1 Tax=Natronogracilivirga saccharolytica TaxID=2812953 RepID=A0A8J7RM43_9BACT|nr:gamma-glutamyltransferase [Natronogracilivirga saccharolytica]MBP3192618.1 gamma-glutamyltransferase [Natronogracilivirga saccharolytica]